MHGDSLGSKKGCWCICAHERVPRGVGVINIIIVLFNIRHFYLQFISFNSLYHFLLAPCYICCSLVVRKAVVEIRM